MGICIHFQGALRDPLTAEAALAVVREAATRRGWPVRDVPPHAATYVRTTRFADPEEDEDDDEEDELTGTLRGLMVEPHDLCEPFVLLLDDDGVFEDHLKTGFAPAEVHLAVVAFFHELESAFTWRRIDDEGEAWPSGDADALDRNRADFEAAIAPFRENPEFVVGHRLEDGRIADVMRTGSDDDGDDDDDDTPDEEGGIPAPWFDPDTATLHGWGWSVDATGWADVTVPGDVVTLQAEHDMALQASNWRMDEAALDDAAVMGFAQQIGNFVAAPAPTSVGPFHGLRFVSNLGTHHFIGWTFRHGAVLILISGTFPVDLPDAGAAIASVTQVVGTLTAQPTEAA